MSNNSNNSFIVNYDYSCYELHIKIYRPDFGSFTGEAKYTYSNGALVFIDNEPVQHFSYAFNRIDIIKDINSWVEIQERRFVEKYLKHMEDKRREE